MEDNSASKYKLKQQLIQKMCNKSCSETDYNMISLLKKEDAEFAKNIEQLERVIKINRDIEFIESIDTDKEYLKVISNKSTRPTQTIVRSLIPKIQRYAAILAIPLLLTSFIMGYMLFMKNSSQATLMAEVIVPSGSIINYELPDKSIVALNSGTTLRYPVKFNSKRREVYIDGEAYFKVTADVEHPFYVHTPYEISSYVYGTQFIVNAYQEDDYVETTLIEGKLNIIDKDENIKALMFPGQGISYDNKTSKIVRKQVDIEEKLAWKSGKLIFRDTPFPELIRRLEHRFNVKLNVIGKVPRDLTLRATFDVHSIEQVLDYMSTYLKCQWQYADINTSIQNYKKEINIKFI